MGKKDKKKGKGADKTANKTEKKAALKLKKELKSKGEDDIEKLIAEFNELDSRRTAVDVKIVKPPSPRSSFSLTAHPDSEELILFGGELFTGNTTFIYNDLYFYNIKKNEWTQIAAPNAPPPRCSHQAVTTSQCGGQLWIFGGEFSSPTQSQFYHYKDLWLFHLESKKWEKINAGGGPSSRSGHRMTIVKKLLIVFGGFHDTVGKYRYFNDLYIFNLETYKWQKIDLQGSVPSPRSGCQMAPLNDGRILIYGGYCKEEVKKDVDKGVVHSDMYYLQPEKDDVSFKKWRFSQVKQSGLKPSLRCGFSLAAVPNSNKAYLFGGVYDVEDNEEVLDGEFYKDLYLLHMDRGTWHMVDVSPKTKVEAKQPTDVDKVAEVEIEEPAKSSTTSDGVFTVTIGPQNAIDQSSKIVDTRSMSTTESTLPAPQARMNAGIAIKSGRLFLYGGIFEEGKSTTTLADFYSLDLRKMEQWNVIIEPIEEGALCHISDESSDEESAKENDEEGEEENSEKAESDDDGDDKSSEDD